MAYKILPIAVLLLVIGDNSYALRGDEDGDGVPDLYDQCMYTPAGVRVKKFEPWPDDRIRAPGLPDGPAVINQGCPDVGEILLYLPAIEFDANSDRISLYSENELAKAVHVLRRNPGMHIQIELGESLAGPQRSLEILRTRSLRDYLALRGINPERVRLAHETGGSAPDSYYGGVQIRVVE